MIVAQMARKMTNIVVQAAIVAILLAIPTVISDNTTPIPAIKSQVNSWFQNNVKPHAVRKANLDSQLVTTKGAGANLDPQLVNAEAGAKIIKVRKDGSGDFKTVNDAIKSIPAGNNKRVIVWIGGGVYKEKIVIERNKPFVTLYGSPNAMPTLTYDGTALQYGTVNSATLAAESDYFIAANIIVSNSSPRPDGKRKGAQAVALRVSGDKAALYNCKIIGFQDTLCDDRGKHLYKDCYIEGTVDFIFGSGKSLYLNTELHVIGEDQGFSVITAQARESESEDTGYSFVHCSITGNGKNTYLGRAWQTRPRVVYAYTNMGSVVNPKGWSDNFHPERDQTVFFREYKCSGPGSITTGRVKFSKILGDAEAQAFLNLAYIEGSKWLLPPPKL